MKSASLTTFALCSLLFACATDPGAESLRDVGDDDVEDVEAKYDGPGMPAGLYDLIDPDRFDEGMPRIVQLDLRSDGTYFNEELGPTMLDDYNFGEGVSTTFGTYKFTRDRWDNRYIRFYDPDHDSTWRWPYKMSGGKVQFIYRTREVGFEMKRAERPTAAFVSSVKSTFETATRTNIADPTPSHWTGALPNAWSERVRDLRIELEDDLEGTMKTWSYKVDGKKVYAIEWGPETDRKVEVFAQSGQLLAKTKKRAPLTWAPLTP
ncbi:MAG: hypothetical protein SFX73_10530 [Kofleriaceae bacterium]|nr:hypothetical protein [Kofleriaceae bacterium]